MKDRLKEIEENASREIEDAQDKEVLESLRIRYLGRKGIITQILRGLKDLPPENRPDIGQTANQVKLHITSLLQKNLEVMRKIEEEKEEEVFFDTTLPGEKFPVGHKHPLVQMEDEIIEIFRGMGFNVKEGPEIETEYYNFEALNTPKDHPARDLQDTFYVDLPPDEKGEYLLRTHTSPVQIHVMERQNPPVRIIAPGRCYRADAFDASHSPCFSQVEGLYVDEGVTFAELKGTLETFAQEMFGGNVKIRFTPHYFPFTEPSAELAISCVICHGKGCRTCGNSGWLELLGCGMVHPAVFKMVGYDSEKYTGYAFGMGIERVAMIKLRIDDIRLFYENDLRFLEQF
jgi:phenylalanyl-tRNA synthetase alpha chain